MTLNDSVGISSTYIDSLWLNLTLFGCFWLSLILFCSVCKCLAWFNSTKSCLTVCVWFLLIHLCFNLLAFVKLCSTLFNSRSYAQILCLFSLKLLIFWTLFSNFFPIFGPKILFFFLSSAPACFFLACNVLFLFFFENWSIFGL